MAWLGILFFYFRIHFCTSSGWLVCIFFFKLNILYTEFATSISNNTWLALPAQLNKNWHFCFGDGRVGGCMGDSGGPIQCQRKDGKYNVVGVTSFGDGKCNVVGSPAIWTRVPSYINWIKQVSAYHLAIWNLAHCLPSLLRGTL